VKLNEDKEDVWHSLQLLGVQFEDYITCDIALAVCGIRSVDMILDKRFARPDEPDEKEEVIECKETFFDALKGLEAARKYIYHSDTGNSTIVMCNKIENKLYRLRKILLNG
jgi:hypothetical protein